MPWALLFRNPRSKNLDQNAPLPFRFLNLWARQAYTRSSLKTSQGAACYRIGRNSPISSSEVGRDNSGAAAGRDRAARSRGGHAAPSACRRLDTRRLLASIRATEQLPRSVRKLPRRRKPSEHRKRQGSKPIGAGAPRLKAAQGSRLSKNPMPLKLPIPRRQPAAADGTSCERGTMRFIMKISWD